MHRASSKWPTWSVIAARLVALLIGLVVLAVIGRVAAAHSAATAERASAIDAGELELAATGPFADAGEAPRPPAPAMPAPQPPAVPPAPAARATAEDPVYVNYASAEQLRRLPGIGAKRAEAIVALRGRMGRFQRVEDLLRVKGIGRATLRKLRPLVRLEMPEGGAQ